MLGLRFCARAFSSCGKWGPLFIAVRGSLTIVASLVAEHRLQTCRLSSCGSRAQFPHGMWDPPRPGLEPVSPALAGRFSTIAPPGKPPRLSFHSQQLSPPWVRAPNPTFQHPAALHNRQLTTQAGMHRAVAQNMCALLPLSCLPQTICCILL